SRPGRSADGDALLEEYGLPARRDPGRGAHPLGGDARPRRRRHERAAGDDVRRGLRRDGLAAYLHARARHGRLRLAAVHAKDARSLGEDEAHQIPPSAPSLTDTCGPCSWIFAPIPLSISIPVAVSEIFWPVAVWSVMPPTPGVSSSVIVWPPFVRTMT